MDDNEYIEGLAKTLYEFERQRAVDDPPIWERLHQDIQQAYISASKAIADYHREHGLRVVPKRQI